MSAISNIPTNKNWLSPLGFKFQIHKTPSTNYAVQTVNIPSVSLGETQVPTPFSRLPLAGDHIIYGVLQIDFLVDEEMRNYKELLDWIKGIGFPDSFNQFKAIAGRTYDTSSGDGSGIYSDATLTILSSAKNPIININFRNIYPNTLTDINFSSTEDDVQYVKASCSFNIQGYDIEYLI